MNLHKLGVKELFKLDIKVQFELLKRLWWVWVIVIVLLIIVALYKSK